MTRVFVADDHAKVRQEIIRTVQSRSDMELVGEVDNGIDAIQSIRELDPDVILLDLKMPKMNGINVTLMLPQKGFRGKVLIVTQYDIEEYIRQAIAAGAHGYVLKDSFKHDLIPAIEAVMNGQTFFSPAISRDLIADCLRAARTTSPSLNPQKTPKPLTGRESEICRLVISGAPSAEISKKLSISQKAVAFHISNILQKYGLGSIQDLLGSVRARVQSSDDAATIERSGI